MEPTLVIMAAGMGSRFGGLKQMTPVDEAGQVILDYSAYDAIQAGFKNIVCVIKKELEADFRRLIGDRIAPHCHLQYAFQALDDLPEGYAVPAGREKPWGTAHAVRAARKVITGPFAVINADDFYGRGAFQALYDFLSQNQDQHTHCLIAYKLKNTLTENGTVARGICTADGAGHLLTVTERTAIQGPADAPSYSEDGDATWTALDPDAPVSLNTWGFHHSFLDAIEARMEEFLKTTLPQNPLKGEFFLPGVVNDCLSAGTDRVQVLHTDEVWHGVTYRNDLPALQAALAHMQQQGIYPKNLWS
jgi:bifunctional N-acetylglucosamine-1-phosphate-uridyltransferase/glucosamine-1-phosphate-acetyltransferase GlmU-like protein